MDCRTPKGKMFLAHQKKVVEVLSARDPRLVFVASVNEACPWDYIGFRTDTNTFSVAMEVKSREKAGKEDFTEEYLRKNGYLITMTKLMDLTDVASTLFVPAVVGVNIVKERKVAVITIWRPEDGKVSDFLMKTTSTQATCNGGTADRENAFITMTDKNLWIYPY